MTYDSLNYIKDNGIYYEYRGIEADSHHEKVRYFEANKGDIQELEFHHRIYIWCDYSLSVFELGRYQEFIKLSDELVPIVIQENVFEHDGMDIYKALLFRKGASLYNIHKLDEAQHIFTELCRMDKDVVYEKAWKQASKKSLKFSFRYLQALSVLLFIITAVIIAGELLIVRNFYPQFTTLVESIRIGTFFAGIFTLIGQEFFIRFRSNTIYNTKVKKKA